MLPQDTGLYINEKEGVQRLQGNTKVYYKLLASFATKNMLAAVEEAVAAGDVEAAASAAHALKGTSANLSMTALYDASFVVEMKLKNSEEYAAEMERLRLVYAKSIEAVHALTG